MAERPDLNKQLAHLEQEERRLEQALERLREERRELINYHGLNKHEHPYPYR